MDANLHSDSSQQDPGLEQAMERLSSCRATRSETNERAFLGALRGTPVREIGRYQVYCDYSQSLTVVFIHDPRSGSEHKYIFAEASQRTYVVACPVDWTALHRLILERINAASGESANCPGGGYVYVKTDGSLVVDRESQHYGRGNHERAKKLLEDAVRRTIKRGETEQH